MADAHYPRVTSVLERSDAAPVATSAPALLAGSQRAQQPPAFLPPPPYFVEVLEEIGWVFVNAVGAGSLELFEPVTA